ncbi:MAG: hypothetical protein COX02_01870 [Candidatus Vogelbacteria bacterium CG22_combo_CG10-13_8_21_14_all_37_9]|uniref:Type II secretion system protein GspH n=1 Tax=Candidatus Vogelbacteria bacterium CG22_combo_CG10-13_8_21_14_all_37_9 TaxID=1975046 RepID=A0A2H0BKE0_9BACT|nr:MAG: hypothetical protein BK005_00940 [bacterium CG10_37_50]PIP58132.1 MAG: hypothetical protein COX02_01870 [Candidatus Vogelbacteria bacterium CG22_combo_CG10-13_8_21_14_all_37_9]
MFSFFKKFRNQKLTAGFNKMRSQTFQSRKNWRAGFSLIEMLVVVSIFTIVTAVVLANLPSFRDKSSLDLVAQEIAIQIRGAQTYAMSTLYDTNPNALETSLFAYAIVLPDGVDKQSFKLRYTDPPSDSSSYCVVDQTGVKEAYVIKGNFEIGKVCQEGVTNPSSISICFKRLNGQLWPTNSNPANYSIIVWSKVDNTKRRYVNVASNGQIYVSNNEPLVSSCI